MKVKDAHDWDKDSYVQFCQGHATDENPFDELLSMCGVPRLLQELQKRQLDHMLTQRDPLLTQLQDLSCKLDVKVGA